MNNNKLIAEFIGYDIITEAEKDKFPTVLTTKDVKYDTSWDWLMPVIDKIESFGIVAFEKNLQEEGDYQCLFTKGYDILICHYADTSLEATYKAVVEFIKTDNDER